MTPSLDIDESRRAPNPILGTLLVLTLALFIGAFSWMSSGQALPLLQLPLVLISFITVGVIGFLYFLNPAKSLTFILLGLLYFAFEFTARSSEADIGGGGAQTMIKGIVAMMFTIFAIFTSSRFMFRAALTGLFILYAAGATATSLYSPAPIFGFVSGLSLLGLAMVAARLSHGDQSDLITMWRAIFFASCLTCLLSLALLAISPQQARDMSDVRYRLRGVTGAANALGPIMAIGFVVSLLMYRVAQRNAMRRFAQVMAVAFVATLLLTNSRSSILGLVAGMVGTALVAGAIGTFGFLVVLLVLAVGGATLLNPGISESILELLAGLFARTGQVTELTTLTGRGVIWEACWKLIVDRPWVGYGLGSVRVVLPLSYADEWGNTYGSAHNFLLESLISVGWIGSLPLIAVLLMGLAFLISYFRKNQQDRKTLAKKIIEPGRQVNVWLGLCALRGLLTLLVQGMSEKSFAGQPGSTTLALGAILATTVYVRRTQARKEAVFE